MGPDRVLTNRVNEEYPEYTDEYSQIYMHKPYRADYTKIPVEDRVTWNSSTERDKYIKEYIIRYGDPKWNWSDYDLHHIIQRQYGGTNDFTNLIPLKRSYHQDIVEGWWRYYPNSNALGEYEE